MTQQERLYTFQCPVCSKKETFNTPAEPLCTGPGAVDNHPPKVMGRIRVKSRDKEKQVSPAEQRALAQGALLLPYLLVTQGYLVDGKLYKPTRGDRGDQNWHDEWDELPEVVAARERERKRLENL